MGREGGRMAETIEEITIGYVEEDGTVVVRELAKEVLTRGAWTTIMFLYEELDRRTGEMKGPKVTIRRYRKQGGYYRQQSRFNISSREQALKVAEVLQRWCG